MLAYGLISPNKSWLAEFVRSTERQSAQVSLRELAPGDNLGRIWMRADSQYDYHKGAHEFFDYAAGSEAALQLKTGRPDR